ncbi:MAG: NTP transferase domain-containing protein [Ignavibacteriales bacterium]|nr:NTP transferase domain-containing protein [Ignavibacteriales bacterium]
MSHIYAVIMAGGVGSRFWPRSRERSPKQLIEIFGSGTMIQNTVNRIQSLVPAMNTFVVTNRLQEEAIYRQLPFLPKENVLVEPVGRNTAPCIGLAALWVRQIDPDGVMLVLPADHLITKPDEFLRIVQLAAKIAQETESLLTIGIKPTHPETGYGYIQFDDEEHAHNTYHRDGVYRVKTFAEKPNIETAQKFLQSGDFLWNSGMFVWKASSILKEIQVHMPDLHEQLVALEPKLRTPEYSSSLEHVYGIIRSISIDYGIMEKAGNVFVVLGDFGWSDVGSWDEVFRLTNPDQDGNAIKGHALLKDAKANYIDAGSKFVGVIGVEDLIIISTDDAVLICKKGRSQDVKEIVDYLRRKQMNEYL